ncbi:MAG: efflux RND transporter permease subunit [Leptospirillum sp.]
MSDSQKHGSGFAGWLSRMFIDSPLTPVLILISLALGGLAIMKTPREEDPQIKVPMMDLFVSDPGMSATEMARHIVAPLERHLSRIKGVKAVYSRSESGTAVVTVRFHVGEPMGRSLVKIYSEVMKSRGYLPRDTGPVVVKPMDINDVPVMAVTLYSGSESDAVLRRLAEEVASSFKRIPGTGQVTVIGGRMRTVRVVLSPSALTAHHLTALDISSAIWRSNRSIDLGSFDRNNISYQVALSGSLTKVSQLRNLVVSVQNGKSIHLSQVATVTDGPGPLDSYVWIGHPPTSPEAGDQTAVTVAVAKKKGINAVLVSGKILEKMKDLSARKIPSDIHWTVTRNYGHTANEKADDLLLHLVVATIAVILLVALGLSLRESGVVAVAIPVTLALTLFGSMMIGYTVNRVTLFALIFSIGILVDDAIVVVENINRHFHFLGGKRDRDTLLERAVYAVGEVGNPTILATFTVIGALFPMAFVSGLMGPYMRPIPVNASLAMTGSLLVALTVVPFLALRMVLPAGHHNKVMGKIDGGIRHLYRVIMVPLLESRLRQNLFFGVVLFLTVGVMAFFETRTLLLKMLPFDNKSELDVVIDMPAGTTLETTARTALALEGVILRDPSVSSDQAYVGLAAPFDFNGLVRHYYLRRGKRVAEIHVNLLPKERRSLQSHRIAEELERKLSPVAASFGARIKMVEVPPGPPVMAPIVAEVMGPDQASITAYAEKVRDVFRHSSGVIDVDSTLPDPQVRYRIRVDQEKAALSGVSTEEIEKALALGLHGETGELHTASGKGYVPIILEVSRKDRSSIKDLDSIMVRSGNGHLVPLGTLIDVSKEQAPAVLYRKNLRPVVYVTGNTTGSGRSPVYAAVDLSRKLPPADLSGHMEPVRQYFWGYPSSSENLSVRWGGEWHVTYVTFRDMGIAFVAAIVVIYLLIVIQFKSYVTPMIIMSPIPLALIGVIPGHVLLGSNFTATSMIGFIALGGIMVRNSILLVDFMHTKKAEGVDLKQAVLEAGAIRTRPILLTALALVAGSFVILSDPIFRGMAIALLSGSIVSTVLTLVLVPLLIARVEGSRWSEGRREVAGN